MRCTLLTRWSALVLKVGVSYTSGETFKSRLACSVVVLIVAYC